MRKRLRKKLLKRVPYEPLYGHLKAWRREFWEAVMLPQYERLAAEPPA